MLHFKRSGYGLTKRQTLSAPCHIKYALTVWIHACPNIPQITKHDLWVRSFFRVIVSSVYPCGAVERLHVHTTHPRETNTGFFFFLLMQTTLCALQIRPEVDCCQSVSRSVSVLLRGLWGGGGKKSWRGSVSSTETVKFKRATCGLRIWREHCEEKNKPDDVLRAGENIDFSYLSMLHFVSYHSPVPVFSLSLCPTWPGRLSHTSDVVFSSVQSNLITRRQIHVWMPPRCIVNTFEIWSRRPQSEARCDHYPLAVWTDMCSHVFNLVHTKFTFKKTPFHWWQMWHFYSK